VEWDDKFYKAFNLKVLSYQLFHLPFNFKTGVEKPNFHSKDLIYTPKLKDVNLE